MKKMYLITILLLFILASVNSFGQVKIGVYTGLGISSFELQDGAADMLPVGLQAYYSMNNLDFISLHFGVDFSYSALPFTFKATDNQGAEVFTREQNQLNVGALVKVKFIKGFILNPFVRLGAGLYSGGQTLKFSNTIVQAAQQQQVSLPSDLEISSGFGFNFGGGVDLNLTTAGNLGLFLEFVYHLNSRELDESPLNIFEGVNLAKRNLSFDSMAINLGFQFGF